MGEKVMSDEVSKSGRKTLSFDNLSESMLAMMDKAFELRREFDLEKENAVREGKLEGEKRISKSMLILKNRNGIVTLEWRKLRRVYKGTIYSEYIPKRRGVIIYDIATLRKKFEPWEMEIVEKYEKLARHLRLDIQELRRSEMKEARRLKKEAEAKKEA